MNEMKRAILLMFSAVSLFAQTKGTPVAIIGYPQDGPTTFLDYAGGSNLTYVCSASPINNGGTPGNYTYSLSVTGGGLTSIVVSANVGTVTTAAAHGLMSGQSVTVSGSTLPALNAKYFSITVTTATAFTITTSGVANATYNNGPLTISGEVPLLTKPIWAIRHFLYDGSNNLTGTQCANGSCSALSNICANRATAVSYK